MKIYGWFVRLARFVYRTFINFTVEGSVPTDSPSIFVVHHQNMSGPVHALLTLPVQSHIWVYKVFCDRKECFRQYYDYTLTKRFGLPKFLAAPCAWILSVAVPWVMRSVSAIPVYRQTRDIVKTFSLSQKCLLNGENIIISPDVDYDDSSDIMGEMYTGFFHLEKRFFKETGKHLYFIPTSFNTKNHKLTLGEAIRFDDATPFTAQKDEVARRIREAINLIKEQEN